MHRIHLGQLAEFMEGQGLRPGDMRLPVLSGFMKAAMLRRGKPLARNTVMSYIITIRSFYRYLYNAGFLDRDLTGRVPIPRGERRLPQVLTRQQAMACVYCWDTSPLGLRNRAIISLLYGGGLRNAELCGLGVNDLHLERRAVLVMGKGAKDRHVPLMAETVGHLESYLGVRHHLLQGKPPRNLFVSYRGKPLTQMALGNLVADTGLQAGIPFHIHPHLFRHSIATHMMDRGANIRTVQEFLGHSSIISTEVYTHISQGDLVEKVMDAHPMNQTSVGDMVEQALRGER